MNLLVLGGTQFAGRHIVEQALARGHRITLFHRGRTNPGLFPEAEELLGDRDGGLSALAGRSWDAAVDVNGYVPRLVRDATRLLAGSTDCYLYISTLAVLADHTIPGQNETAPRAAFEKITTEEITGETYGPLKAACEAVVEAAMGDRAAILRPGFIVGPWDHTGRFNYWIRRASEGGDMLAPGTPGEPIQFIDARDLAAFVLRVLETRMSGTYHVVGPRAPLSWAGLFEECNRVAGKDTRVVWVAHEFLDARGVSPKELPMRFRNADGLEATSSEKAIARGLTFLPVSQTIRDTLQWDAAHGAHEVGLSADRERELLAQWHGAKQPA